MNDDNNKLFNHNVNNGCIDGAVGVPEHKWFVAIVNNRSEKSCAEKLTKMGIENYLPVQTIFKLWKNGKKAKVDKVVISNIVFIHCTEQKRREIVRLPYIFRFMTNKAGKSKDSLSKPLAVVSDKEINRLKFMLGQSDIPVTLSARPYSIGDKVKVVRGHLAGLEGEVLEMDSEKSELIIALELFGCAILIVDTIDLELINEN